MYVLVGVVVALLVSMHVYRHVSSPFWSKQPVYHTYDVVYWFEKGRIINPGRPLLNRYVCPDAVQVRPMEMLAEADQDRIAKLIKKHYLRTDDVEFLPEPEHIFDYLSRKGCFVAQCIDNGKLLGVLTSRVLNGKIPGSASIPIAYVDNLTVASTHRGKGIAPKLIQTYTHTSRALDPQTLVHLFKREGTASTTNVPLCSFQAAIYNTSHLPARTDALHDALSARRIDRKDYSALRICCDREIADAAVAIRMQYSDLFLLVDKEHIQIIVCRRRNRIEHFFFVRTPPVYDGDKRPILELFALASAPGCQGYEYLPLVIERLRETHEDFCIVVERSGKLEAIANQIAVEPLVRCPMAFFLYNYACQTVATSRCFMLY